MATFDSFVPVSYRDQGDSIIFTDGSGESVVVSKNDRQTIARVFNNMATLPALPADIQAILSAVGSPYPTEAEDLKEMRADFSTDMILDMHDTPVLIIPAPSANQVIEIDTVTMFSTPGATPFVDDNLATFMIGYEGDSDSMALFSVADTLTATAGKIQTAKLGTPVVTLAAAFGKAMVLSLDNAVTAGDGQIYTRVTYRLRSLA